MIKEYSLKNDGNTYLSQHFQVKEFRCRDGNDCIMIDTQLVNLLEAIRQHYNKAVHINSAYRTSIYNSKIGGSPSSRHLTGQASDIYINDVTPKMLYTYINSIIPNCGGIGLYKTFVHVDTRPTKSRWDYSNK